jgi:hypothetical protein
MCRWGSGQHHEVNGRVLEELVCIFVEGYGRMLCARGIAILLCDGSQLEFGRGENEGNVKDVGRQAVANNANLELPGGRHGFLSTMLVCQQTWKSFTSVYQSYLLNTPTFQDASRTSLSARLAFSKSVETSEVTIAAQ